MKKCPFCKKEIELNETECPFCKMVLVERVPFSKIKNMENKKELDTGTPPVWTEYWFCLFFFGAGLLVLLKIIKGSFAFAFIMLLIAGGPLVLALCLPLIGEKLTKWSVEAKERERITQIEKERVEKEREYEQQEILERWKKSKEEEYQKRSDLRKQIEQMPIYERWRRDVMKKCGSKCQICRSPNNLEVHHNPSFDSILRRNGIISKEQAVDCKELWDIDNGEILCKECHNKMESSKKRNELISTNV